MAEKKDKKEQKEAKEEAKEKETKEQKEKKLEKKADEVKLNTETIKLVLIGLLAVVAIINLALLTNVENRINEKINLAKPAEVDVASLWAASCNQCIDTAIVVEAIKEKGVNVAKEEKFEINSNEAKNLIEKYSIKKIPAVVVTGELNKASQLEDFMNKVKDALVFESIQPPYVDSKSKEIIGFADLILLTDKSCTQCYNVTLHKAILSSNFGLVFGSEKTFDVSGAEGKQILSKYNVELVPTVIISKEASLYPALEQVWPDVGSVEEDGSYIFRNFKAWPGQTYKNLSNGTILKG